MLGKKAFCTEHVNAIAHPSTPTKLKDPGMPTIACIIGSKLVKDALLDLGSSVNLMPYSLYLQLGLGEMQPTGVTLQLADCSWLGQEASLRMFWYRLKISYYHVDFIVLDIKGSNSSKHSNLILGRPFLAICNALINCRDGQLKMSFGNMTTELNIFKNCKVLPQH